MLPREVLSEIQRIDEKIDVISNTIENMNDSGSLNDISMMQNIAVHYIIIASSGLVETGIQGIIKDYCNHKCEDDKLKKYIESHLEREWTMNCPKIVKLLQKFDPSWAKSFREEIQDNQKSAINSIKTNRDKCAHGDNNNSIGIDTAKNYYNHSKETLELLCSIVNRSQIS
jgi:hypothetical protein